MRVANAPSPAVPLLLLLAFAATGAGLRVSGVRVPPVVVSGSAVDLTCHYHHSTDRPDPLYSIKWYRDVNQFYEYIPRRKPPIRVYPLPNIHVDRARSSQATVALKGVTRETSGSFRCEVMGDKPFFETDDHAVNMTVVDVPAWGPEVWGAATGARVRPGEVVAVRCLMGPSDPPADVSWTVNGEAAPPDAVGLRPLARGPRGRLAQASELRVTATEEWLARGAMTLTCHAQVSSVYHATANVTLVHSDWPQPAEFGWFSAAPAAPNTPCCCVSCCCVSCSPLSRRCEGHDVLMALKAPAVAIERMSPPHTPAGPPE
ncbi:uncharacterized protein LOC123513497 isoform X2 [Portunus trituberculatus]|nr:uncharacterized protein LOC123513497 isoform X2 [Portunus trituberculatus]